MRDERKAHRIGCTLVFEALAAVGAPADYCCPSCHEDGDNEFEVRGFDGYLCCRMREATERHPEVLDRLRSQP